MKIISFAWTAEALLAGRKTVTRRDWTDRYATRFKAGDVIAAYDNSPRHGGRQIATLRLTADPVKESTRLAPEEDYEAEGFAYLAEKGLLVDNMSPVTLWRIWHQWPWTMWVIRFELLE